MAHYRDTTGLELGANRSCFTCQHFQGLAMGNKAGCDHRRHAPAFDQPQQGCLHWVFNRSADEGIRTVEDWHVHASRAVPGFDEPDKSIPWREPLTSSALHKLCREGAQSPSTSPLAWEIARQRNLVIRLRGALLVLAKDKMPLRARVILRRLADRIAEEPCVTEQIQKAIERGSDPRRK